jgi:hypothetical protein
MDIDIENNDTLSNPFMFYKYKLSDLFEIDEINKLIQLFNNSRTNLFNLIEVMDTLPIHKVDYYYLFNIREPLSDLYEMPVMNMKFFRKSKKYMYFQFKQVFNSVIQDLDEVIMLLKNRRELIKIKEE